MSREREGAARRGQSVTMRDPGGRGLAEAGETFGFCFKQNGKHLEFETGSHII